jgi:hypothetical protein
MSKLKAFGTLAFIIASFARRDEVAQPERDEAVGVSLRPIGSTWLVGTQCRRLERPVTASSAKLIGTSGR